MTSITKLFFKRFTPQVIQGISQSLFLFRLERLQVSEKQSENAIRTIFMNQSSQIPESFPSEIIEFFICLFTVGKLFRIDTVNVKITGHDFGPLEKYQAYIHKTASRFGFLVVDR